MSHPDDGKPRKRGLSVRVKIGAVVVGFVLGLLGLSALDDNDDDDYEGPTTSQYEEDDD